ncbi:hypothetical protein [Helicobacter ibis]|uniref:RCK N-terminal domain-containing protein n=1 Tax=Helicobacter ibis TaxID=2962633 RepID=A0ABT4VFR8_9HELI|nr:hypothetical protein [Helicobacter ibis]MDA3969572.1 hypothetical protein [Helicobacter ibis]
MNVLIYGFGWTGRACLHLLESFGISCKIIDDSLNVVHDKFVSLDSVDDFDLILIAVSNKQNVIDSINNKILAAGGGGL